MHVSGRIPEFASAQVCTSQALAVLIPKTHVLVLITQPAATETVGAY